MTSTGEKTEAVSGRRIAELHTLLDQGIREGVRGTRGLVLDPSPATINALFTVHGGVLATLMDTGMGSAVFTCLGDGAYYTTLELKANFIRSVRATGHRLTCVGQIIHVGRSTATAEARITNPEGALVAHVHLHDLLSRPALITPQPHFVITGAGWPARARDTPASSHTRRPLFAHPAATFTDFAHPATMITTVTPVMWHARVCEVVRLQY